MSLMRQLTKLQYKGLAVDGELSLSFSDVLKQAEQLRFKNAKLRDGEVVLTMNDICHFIISLVAFDGWCKRLYLMPNENLSIPDTDNIANNTTTSNTQWLLATSGTTGSPKWIRHSSASLTRAIIASEHTKLLKWALCYQATRFAGLQVVLQSLLSGAVLVNCCEGDATQRLNIMKKYSVNAVSATPSLWRQFLMANTLTQLKLMQITLGGEIADQHLLNNLSKQFTQAKIVHIYASTEAGVGFAVNDKNAGFPAAWLNTTRNGVSFKMSEEGHLLLKPPGTNGPSQESKDYIDTGDKIKVQNARCIFLGRANGAINVGGNKVHPEHVEQVLLQHPDVLHAQVYGKKSSILGQLVAANIVANSPLSASIKQELQALCQQSLARYETPSSFKFMNTLDILPSGKLSRQ